MWRKARRCGDGRAGEAGGGPGRSPSVVAFNRTKTLGRYRAVPSTKQKQRGEKPKTTPRAPPLIATRLPDPLASRVSTRVPSSATQELNNHGVIAAGPPCIEAHRRNQPPAAVSCAELANQTAKKTSDHGAVHVLPLFFLAPLTGHWLRLVHVRPSCEPHRCQI